MKRDATLHAWWQTWATGTWQRFSPFPPACTLPSLCLEAKYIHIWNSHTNDSSLWCKYEPAAPSGYLMGFMSGLLGLATAFTNFSAIFILRWGGGRSFFYDGILIESTKSWRTLTAGGAALPLVEVFIPDVCAVQDQRIHHVDGVYSALCFALKTNDTVWTHVEATNCLDSLSRNLLYSSR